MTTFVDTSALLAVLDADDRMHEAASRAWRKLVTDDEALVTTNYVLVETFAIVQRRLGMTAVRVLDSDVLPLVETIWMDSASHDQAVAVMAISSRRGLSLVDCASFGAMRALGIERVFGFDDDFSKQGFELVPQ